MSVITKHNLFGATAIRRSPSLHPHSSQSQSDTTWGMDGEDRGEEFIRKNCAFLWVYKGARGLVKHQKRGIKLKVKTGNIQNAKKEL